MRLILQVARPPVYVVDIPRDARKKSVHHRRRGRGRRLVVVVVGCCMQRRDRCSCDFRRVASLSGVESRRCASTPPPAQLRMRRGHGRQSIRGRRACPPRCFCRGHQCLSPSSKWRNGDLEVLKVKAAPSLGMARSAAKL